MTRTWKNVTWKKKTHNTNIYIYIYMNTLKYEQFVLENHNMICYSHSVRETSSFPPVSVNGSVHRDRSSFLVRVIVKEYPDIASRTSGLDLLQYMHMYRLLLWIRLNWIFPGTSCSESFTVIFFIPKRVLNDDEEILHVERRHISNYHAKSKTTRQYSWK